MTDSPEVDPEEAEPGPRPTNEEVLDMFDAALDQAFQAIRTAGYNAIARMMREDEPDA